MDRIAVLIPCYNEAQTIEKVITDWKTALPEAVIYVYDNNSSDNTAELARAAGAVVRQEPQQGKGNVVRSMFQDIDAECYFMVDGDDTYSADTAPEMAKDILENQFDMVIGDRLSSTYFSENKRPFHGFGNTLVRFSINRMFQSDVRDVMTGLRAMSYRFVKSFPVISEGFEIETEMTIHAIDKNMALKNEIIEYRDRPEGSESKLNTFSDGFKVLRTIRRLFIDYRPSRFFGMIAFILIALAVGFFIPVFHDYLSTGLVERFPTLIVCGFSAITGIASLFTGLILSTLKNRERREFEFRLQSIAQWKKDR